MEQFNKKEGKSDRLAGFKKKIAVGAAIASATLAGGAVEHVHHAYDRDSGEMKEAMRSQAALVQVFKQGRPELMEVLTVLDRWINQVEAQREKERKDYLKSNREPIDLKNLDQMLVEPTKALKFVEKLLNHPEQAASDMLYPTASEDSNLKK